MNVKIDLFYFVNISLKTNQSLVFPHFRWWENKGVGQDSSGYLNKGFRNDILEPLVLKFVSGIYQNKY